MPGALKPRIGTCGATSIMLRRELLTRILGSLGVDARSRESLAQAVEARAWRAWHPPIAPTLVLAQAPPPYEISISLTETQAAGDAVLDIRLEQGGGNQIRIALGELPVVEETVLRGERFVRKRIRLSVELPLGYHHLSLQMAGEALASTRLIVCPERAYQPQWLEQGPRRGTRHQPVRRTVEPQLGLRRHHRSEGHH